MDTTSKNDPFIEHTNLEIGNESSESDTGSESSSSSSGSSDSPDSGISPSSSDSDASGAPLRDATKKLFQKLYNSCKDSDLQSLKSILPEVVQLARSGRATNLLNQPNIKDRYRRTPLLAAIEGGNLELIELLLKHGADPKRETKAPDSCNGIMLAFRYGHTAVAEYLLDHDYFDLNNDDNIFSYTLLHQAAYGAVEPVKMLIRKGANVNSSSAFQVTPLHSAVSAGNPQVVSELLKNGADANAKDKFGRTALYLACNSFNLQIVKYLVEDGKCDVNITDTNGNSAFDIADRKNLREVCRYLLQHGAIPRAIKENASGLGALRFFRPYIASGSGHPDLLPTARTKAGLCAIGTKLYLNGGVGLRTIQNRPDESLFNHPNLLTDLFVLDLKDRKLQSMVPQQELETLMRWCKDTSKEDAMAAITAASGGDITSLTSSASDLHQLHHQSTDASDSNVPIIVATPPTPPRSPTPPSPLVMSRQFRSDRMKVSKDGLTVQSMPPGYQSGTKKLSLPFRVTAQTAMQSYQSEPNFVACVKATQPFARDKTTIAYWEMHVYEATEKVVAIGFTHDDFPLNRFHPGWCLDSYAYHNDDGSAFHVKAPIPDHGFQWGPRFTTGDIVGAGINYHTNEVFFTKNGKFLGVAYRGVTGDHYYATISFGSVGAKVKVNLGRKPFKFNFLVPTLSWTKLGHTMYSPLAFVPHPEGNHKFIQISYGDATAPHGSLVSQRGNHWHSPKVSIVNTDSASEGLAYTDVTEQFVHVPFVRKMSTEEKKREKEMQQQNQQQDGASNAATALIPIHPPSHAMQSPHAMATMHHHHHHHHPTNLLQQAQHGAALASGTTASTPIGSNARVPLSSSPSASAPASPQISSRGSPGKFSSPAATGPNRSGSAAPSSSAPPNSSSAPPPGSYSVPERRRRPSKPYRRINRYADSESEESASSVSSAAFLDDSLEDSADASFDPAASEPIAAPAALSRVTSVASFDSWNADSGSDTESIMSGSSSGDEADEEDDREESDRTKRPKRRTAATAATSVTAVRSGRPIGGAEHLQHRHYNRNAPSYLLPTEFYMPECDYQVHYTSSAVFLFAPADEEDLQLVRLNIHSSQSVPTTPTGASAEYTSVISQAGAHPVIPTSTTPTPANPIATGSASTAPAPSVSYSYTWSDILAEYPSIRRELMRLQEPHSALIQGFLYFFSQTQLLKLDIATMKFEVKPLQGIGPRGTNYTSTVICPETAPLVAGAAHVLCFGGVAGNIAQSAVHTLDVVSGEWDVPHLSGVNPRPRVEPGGLVYVGDDQHIVVIQGGWNGKNYIDDLDFLHLEEPIAPDPLIKAINNEKLFDFIIWAYQDPNPVPESLVSPSPNVSADSETQKATVVTETVAPLPERISSKPLLTLVSPITRSGATPVPENTTSDNTKLERTSSSGAFSAVATSAGSRKQLLLSKAILSSRSSFFKTLFELEPDRKEFTLDAKTDFRLFAAFIKYLYTDNIEPDLIDDTNAPAFFELFSRFAPKHRERVAEELLITRPAIKSMMDSDLSHLVNNPLFADLTFSVAYKDEPVVTVYGHRAVLCTRNDVFAQMFGGQQQQPSQLASANEKSNTPSTMTPVHSTTTPTVGGTAVAGGTYSTPTSPVPVISPMVSKMTTASPVPGIVALETNSGTNSTIREATIKGTPAWAFLEVLRFIYSNDILPDTRADLDKVLQVLSAAHRYGVKGLQTLTTEIISTSYTVDNAIHLLALADQLALKKLVKQTISFIRANMESIQHEPDYKTQLPLIQKSLDTYFPQ